MKKWSIDLPYITPKQEEIMVLIYRFRFLNRIQIQTLMHHKDYKRINVWLKDLVHKGYLIRMYERKIPVNMRPAIYHVAPTGVRFLRKFDGDEVLHKLYRETQRSERFCDHCITIGNTYINLLRLTTNSKALEYFKTKPELTYQDNMISQLPDAIFSLIYKPSEIIAMNEGKILKKEEKPTIYFFEVIDKGTPRYAMRHRIKQYIEYLDLKYDTFRRFPKILFVCPDELTVRFLTKYINNAVTEQYYLYTIKATFHITSAESLHKEGIFGNIWRMVKKEDH